METDVQDQMTGVTRLKAIMVSIATGTSYKEPGLQFEYEQIRSALIADPAVKRLLPQCVLSCRLLNEFWGYIQPKFSHYAERRTYLGEQFEPLLTALETNTLKSPTDDSIAESLKNLDSNEVNSIWAKAIDRRANDPEGALTISRTLLESTIKHILDDLSEPFDEKDELPQLYKKMAKRLDLAPNQQTEAIFRQLLSGCHNVVEGIGAIRNKLSDAHGRGRTQIDLSDRHVELGVNLAGALATFWVKTFKARKEQGE